MTSNMTSSRCNLLKEGNEIQSTIYHQQMPRRIEESSVWYCSCMRWKETNDERFKPDHEWVQCDKCRKWRMLSAGFDIKSLPIQWFCYMPPFNGSCEVPEQQMEAGVVTIAATRHLHDPEEKFQTKSGQPSPSPQVIVKDESGINSHAVTKCEDWGQKERRSLRTPKHTDKPIPPAGNNDLKPNHRRNFKRQRNFKSTGPQGREEDSYDQKAEVRTHNFFHKKDNRASYHN